MEEPSGNPVVEVMVDVVAVKTVDMKCKGGRYIMIAKYLSFSKLRYVDLEVWRNDKPHTNLTTVLSEIIRQITF